MDIFKRLTVGVRFDRAKVPTVNVDFTAPIVSRDAAGRARKRSAGRDKYAATLDDSSLDFFKDGAASSGSGNRSASADEKASLKEQRGKHLQDEDSARRSKKRKLSRPLFANQAEVDAFRTKHHIKIYGNTDGVPAPIKKFAHLERLGVSEDLIKTIEQAQFKWPSSVQKQAIPLLLQRERDAIIVAPTGSGKTLTFVVSVLTNLKTPRSDGVRAIIVSPTRELAQQIHTEMKRFCPVNPKSSKKSDNFRIHLITKPLLNSWNAKKPEQLPDVLVTTPLRLVQAVKDKLVDLSSVTQIILDEADKLLDLGFLDQIDDILAACQENKGVQKAIFSATIPSGIEDIARTFMQDPVRVVIGRPNASVRTIEQKLVYVGQDEGKIMAIRQMLVEGIEPPVIIFTETIVRAQELYKELVRHGIQADVIHSERTTAEREKAIRGFRAGTVWFLITTELLARGLDFPEVACVINYDFPPTPASYIHRIGRTGRAGKSGKAITFFTKQDAESLKVVVNVMRSSGCDVPEWMLALHANKPTRLQEMQRKQRKKIAAQKTLAIAAAIRDD